MKKIIVISSIIFTIILIRVEYKGKRINKYVEISDENNKIEFKILKTQKR